MLARPTRFGASKLGWKEIGDGRPGVAARPRRIAFELPEHFGIDLRDFAVRPVTAGALPAPIIKDSYDLGFLFGTFLGDGHAFLNSQRPRHRPGVVVLRRRRGRWSTKLAVDRPAGHRRPPRRSSGSRAADVHLYSLQWARLLGEFGKRTEKHLPPSTCAATRDYLHGLLRRAGRQRRPRRAGRPRRASATPRRGWSSCSDVLCLLVHG